MSFDLLVDGAKRRAVVGGSQWWPYFQTAFSVVCSIDVPHVRPLSTPTS
jgi:hypothetical protein